MADFMLFPIDRTWYTVSFLSKFVVDITDANGIVRRGYVCDKSENGLLVKVGSGRQTLLIPFHRLSIPNDDIGDISSITHDIEVLVDLNTDCDSWQRATLISSCECAYSRQYGDYASTYTLLYLKLEHCPPSTASTRSILIDGPTRNTQRARTRGQLSSEVTGDTFYKLIVPMPQPTRECPEPVSSLRTAVVLPRFQEYWLSFTCTLFVAVTDNHVEVLKLMESPRTRAAELSASHLVTEAIRCRVPHFLERFDKLCFAAVLDMINDMTSAISHLNDASDANDPCFRDLPVVIHLLVLSNLDVYDQNLLKRASKFCTQLLSSLSAQMSAIISAKSAYNVRSLESTTYWLEKNSFTLLHIILRTATRNLKFLYLTGDWLNCLHPLTCILSLMSIKLDWLVVGQNSHLQINEFISFPQPRHIFSDPLPIPSYWNICHNFALKNVVFSSYYSICFQDHGNCRLSPSSLNCCYGPFLIPVSRWTVNLVSSSLSAEKRWDTSARLMFHDFCSQMNSQEISTLMDWLSRTEMVENLVLWTCICRCFSLWGVNPPGDVGGLRCVVVNGRSGFVNPPKEDPNAPQRLRCALSRNFPEKNIIMRTVALLMPHADCVQQLPEHILEGS